MTERHRLVRTIAGPAVLAVALAAASSTHPVRAGAATATTTPRTTSSINTTATPSSLLPRLAPTPQARRATLSVLGSDRTVRLAAAKQQPGAVRVSPLIKPGMRLTFWSGSRSNQNPAIPAKPDDVTASASAGYTQVNIVDVVGDQAIVNVRQYLPDSLGNGVYTYMSTGAVVSVAKGGDFWKSPADLAAATTDNSGGADVNRLTYPLDGKSYRAVRFTVATDTATFQSTYDLDTGVMIAHGESTNAGRSSTIVQLFFKGARQVRQPWTGQRAPASVQGIRSLDFQGSEETAIDGAYSTTSRLTQRWEVTKSDAVSMSARVTSLVESQYSAPQQSTENRIVPMAGIWIDPRVLATLRAGMVLDDDPITGVRQSVLGVQNGMVIIGEQAAVQASAVGYDQQTGLISALQTQLRTPPATRTTLLQRAG